MAVADSMIVDSTSVVDDIIRTSEEAVSSPIANTKPLEIAAARNNLSSGLPEPDPLRRFTFARRRHRGRPR